MCVKILEICRHHHFFPYLSDVFLYGVMGDSGLSAVGGRMHRGVRPGIEMIFCWDLFWIKSRDFITRKEYK